MAIKLVIVDDAPFIREVVRHVVKDTEILVVGEAQDGNEAIELAQSLLPHVILMDLVMPLKNGIEATREISAQFPQIKVIACSTLDQEAMVLNALEAGCCHYIEKPFKKEELLIAIRQAVGSGPRPQLAQDEKKDATS